MTAYGTTGNPFPGDVVSQDDFATTDDWARFLGRLYADINGPYYGGEGNLTSVDLRPGYIVNYLFASGIIDGPTLDRIIEANGGDPNGLYAGIINSNPDTEFQYRWHKNREYNIAYCEENGCRDAAMQRFYDKWKASGEPTTKDGMWSDEQFDEWLEEQTVGPVDPIDPGPEPPQTLDDLLSEIAEEQQVDRDVVDGVVDMIETIKGSIPTDLESASDLIKGVLSSTVLGSAIEECESWTGNTTTEGGRGVPSWTKCVDVGIFGIPGLDLPLPPGMVDISTSVYDIIQKGEDIGESFEDFLEDPSGWLENVIDKAVEKVQEVWGDLQAGVDPKTIGGLSGILNDWIGNILGGYILGQVKDATSAIDPFLYAGDCLDPTFKEANKDFCEDALNEGALVDCSAQFGKTGGFVVSASECGTCEDPNFTPTGPNGTCVDPDPNDCAGQNKALKSDGTCGECLDTTQKDFGQGCVDVCEYDDRYAAGTEECKPPWTDEGETEEECAAEGRLHVPGDAATETDSSCGDCLPTHIDEDGTCTEWTDGGPTEEECNEQNKVYRPSTGTGRDSSCGGCADGYELINGKCEEEGFEPPCPGNQVRNEETRECEDPPPDFVPGDPCTTEDGKAGTYDSEGGCVPDWVNPGPTVQDCEALGKTHVSGDPSAQKPSECGGCKNSTWNPIGANGECVAPVKCWDDSTAATEAECPEEPQLECWDGQIVNDLSKCSEEPLEVDCAAQNKVQDTPYECGGCLPDFNLEGNECVAPPEVVECNAETATSQVSLTETIPFGDPLPDPTTTYEDDGTQCVATTTTYVQGENPCATIDDSNYDECGYDKCPEGSESPYVKDGVECIASVIECTDPNRNTNEDGSCAEGCKDGYRLQPGEGGETLCLPPQFPCWDNTLAFTEAECDEEPPAVNCADANRKQVDAYTCGPCLADYKEGAEGCVPETCEDNGQTTSLVDGKCLDCSGEITRDNFRDCGYKNCGSGVYVPQDQECGYTGVCDDGLEAVSSEGCHVCADNTPKAGQSVSSPEACGEPTTVDPNECVDGAPRDARGNCPEDYCPDGVTLKDSPGGCPEIGGPDGCENGEADFGKGAGCEQPCPDNANIGISDAACGETTVTTCLDDTATNFNEEGPCVFGPVVEPECENGAIDYPLCSECADGGLPDADLGCGVDNPCDDPVYAAENPIECTSGPDCVDCTCAEYAAANPEECIGTPPPPPEGGGGGGSGGQGERDPFEFGISGDPELLDRMQFPITDYLSGLFTGNR